MPDFPTIETPRLLLTNITAADIPSIVAYAGNRKIAEMTLNLPHPYAEKDAIWWINRSNQGFATGSNYTFAVRLKETKAFMGGIGLIMNQRFNRAEMGYWIAEPFWNQGYMSEAAGGLLDFGFNTLDLRKILATHLVENPASGKVMINNGMIKEGEMKDHAKKDGEYKSLVQYRLTKDEYKALRNS